MAVSQMEASSPGAPSPAVPRPIQPPQAGSGQALQPLAITQIDDRRRDSALDGRTFSLSFSEPISIGDLLLLLVRDTDLSVAPAPDVQGTFNGDLKHVTVRQALELVLPPLGLDYSVQGSFVRVFRRRVEMRLFEINYLASRRQPERPVPASSAMSAGRDSRPAPEQNPGLFEELAAGVRSLLSPDGAFSLDRQAGLLRVSDYPDRLDRIGLYLEAVQVRALRQVQLQADVIEVDLDERHQRGVDWLEVLASAGESVSVTQPLAHSGGSGGATLAANIRDRRGLLDALATQGTVNVLASPRVVAMHNEPAFMRVGTQDVFFVRTSQVDAATGRVVQTTVTPQPITEGILLTVTPQIAGDGTVQMSISPSISERTGQATSQLGDTVPIVSIREADTLVRTRENETLVMSGLMQTRASRGSEPTLKGLFRRDEPAARKVDLVILLRANVVAPGAVMEVAAGEATRGDLGRPPARK